MNPCDAAVRGLAGWYDEGAEGGGAFVPVREKPTAAGDWIPLYLAPVPVQPVEVLERGPGGTLELLFRGEFQHVPRVGEAVYVGILSAVRYVEGVDHVLMPDEKTAHVRVYVRRMY